MLASRYLIYNKKRTFTMILSVSLSVLLLLSVGLIFSSIHNYMVRNVLRENPYHVYFESENFEKPSYVSKKKYVDGKVYIKYKSVFNTYKNTKEICNKVKCQNITYNDKLLSLYGISKNNNLMDTFKVLLFTLLTILGVAVFIFLSNSFRVMLIERQKQIGVLKSIGLTKFGIIKMALEEGTITLVIGLIFGIMLSMWFVQILIVVINYLLTDIFEIKLILSMYPLFIIISFVFIIVIFYISCLFPTFKISRLSIMDMIKGSDDFKGKNIPWYAYKFRIINRLAFSNYYRAKKKYRAIKLCVFISSILYLSFSLYLSYGISGINKYVNIPDYDFELMTTGNDENYKKLKQFGKKYDKYGVYKSCELKGNVYKNDYLNKKDYSNNKNIIVFENKKEGIINYASMKDKYVNHTKKYLKKKVRINTNKDILVNTINNIPFGLDGYLNKDNIVFLTNDFDSYCLNYNVSLYIKCDSSKIMKNLKKLNIKTEISYVDVAKASRLTNNFILTLKISLYSILTLIITIGVCLISSIFSMNINLRIKELGILKGIGFTNRQLKRLLFTESLMVIFKVFIYVVIFGFLISYGLYKSVNELMTMEMILPIKELFICLIVSLFIIYFTLISNYKKISMMAIIKMISNDNI